MDEMEVDACVEQLRRAQKEERSGGWSQMPLILRYRATVSVYFQIVKADLCNLPQYLV